MEPQDKSATVQYFTKEKAPKEGRNLASFQVNRQPGKAKFEEEWYAHILELIFRKDWKQVDKYFELHLSRANKNDLVKRLVYGTGFSERVIRWNGITFLSFTLCNEVTEQFLNKIITEYPRNVKDYESVMYYALQSKSSKNIIKILLESFPQHIITAKYKLRRNVLHQAMINNNSEDVVHLLLAKYPDGLKETDDRGSYPLHYYASEYKNPQKVVLPFLDRYPDAVCIKDTSGFNPLHYAAEHKDSSKSFQDFAVKYFEVIQNPNGENVTDLQIAFQSIRTKYKSKNKWEDEMDRIFSLSNDVDRGFYQRKVKWFNKPEDVAELLAFAVRDKRQSDYWAVNQKVDPGVNANKRANDIIKVLFRNSPSDAFHDAIDILLRSPKHRDATISWLKDLSCRTGFVLFMTLQLYCHLLWIVSFIMASQAYLDGADNSTFIISTVLLFLSSGIFLLMEVFQLMQFIRARQTASYFFNVWNFFDVLTPLCVSFSATMMHLGSWAPISDDLQAMIEEGALTNTLFSVTFTLQVISFLGYLRSLNLQFSTFYRGVINIFQHLVAFVLVLLLLLLLFAYLYYILNKDGVDREGSAFRSLGDSFEIVFHYLFSGPLSDNFLDYIYGIFVFIILLNGVVLAVVTSNWGRAQEQSEFLFWRYRIQFIRDISFLHLPQEGWLVPFKRHFDNLTGVPVQLELLGLEALKHHLTSRRHPAEKIYTLFLLLISFIGGIFSFGILWCRPLREFAFCLGIKDDAKDDMKENIKEIKKEIYQANESTAQERVKLERKLEGGLKKTRDDILDKLKELLQQRGTTEDRMMDEGDWLHNNIQDHGNTIEWVVDVPGVEPSTLKAVLHESTFTLSGLRQSSDGAVKSFHSEFNVDTSSIDSNSIKADLNSGVLRITADKRINTGPCEIPITFGVGAVAAELDMGAFGAGGSRGSRSSRGSLSAGASHPVGFDFSSLPPPPVLEPDFYVFGKGKEKESSSSDESDDGDDDREYSGDEIEEEEAAERKKPYKAEEAERKKTEKAEEAERKKKKKKKKKKSQFVRRKKMAKAPKTKEEKDSEKPKPIPNLFLEDDSYDDEPTRGASAMTKSKPLPKMKGKQKKKFKSQAKKEQVPSVMPKTNDHVSLLIQVISCRDILAANEFDASSDPFVAVYLGDEKIHKTKYIAKTLNPDFHSTFVLNILFDKLLSYGGLLFTVFDFDMLSADDPLGSVKVSAADLIHMNGKTTEYKITAAEHLGRQYAGHMAICVSHASSEDREAYGANTRKAKTTAFWKPKIVGTSKKNATSLPDIDSDDLYDA